MGNSQATGNQGNKQATHDLKSAMQIRRERKEQKYFADFFQRLSRKYSLSHQLDAASLSTKRTVFISINGLYHTWKECPPISLYNAIFILPLKQEWIRSPHRYRHQFSDLLQDETFLTLLRWKCYQNLMLFLADEYPCAHCNDQKVEEDIIVSPVWKVVSYRLQQLSDPSKPENTKYNALHFSAAYWKYQSSVSNQVNRARGVNTNNLTANDVLLELYFVRMKFASIRQILLESNPSLNVLTHYSAPGPHESEQEEHSVVLPLSDACSLTYSSVSVSSENMYEQVVVKNEEHDMHQLNDDWWIADDYEDTDNGQELVEFGEK